MNPNQHPRTETRSRSRRVLDYLNNRRRVARLWRRVAAMNREPTYLRGVRGILYDVNSGLHALWKELKHGKTT